MESQQFVWTKKYNRILALFYEEVPLNANRHYFKSFPNSFSGRSALDTMESVLSAVFPEKDIQRNNAQKVLELLLRDGLVVAVHRSVDAIRDEKDVFYRFGKQFPDAAEKYISRPRRSVSVDDNRKRFIRQRMSISTNEFRSDPDICAPSTSSSSSSDSVSSPSSSINSSMESVNEEQEDGERDSPISKKQKKSARKMDVDAAAMRFLRWIHEDSSMADQQKRKTVKAFKAHYPHVYQNFVASQASCCKAASLDSQSTPLTHRRQRCFDHGATGGTLSPASSLFSLQSDAARSFDEPSTTGSLMSASGSLASPRRKISSRMSESDLNAQLLSKLDSVIEDPTYSESDRQRILKYFKHVYPAIYYKRFDEDRPLLKKIRDFLPKKITAEVR